MRFAKEIRPQFGLTGWVLAFSASTFVLLCISAWIDEGLYRGLTGAFAMPMEWGAFFHKPWTVVTYWFVLPPEGFFMLFSSLLVLWSIGKLLESRLEAKRYRHVLVAAVLGVAILSLALVSINPWAEQTDKATLMGLMPTAMVLTGVSMAMMPHLPVRVLNSEIRFIWVGLFVILLPIVGFRAIFTCMGTAVLGGALMGYGMGLMMQRHGKPIGWKSLGSSMSFPWPGQKKNHNPLHRGKFTVVHGPGNRSDEEELNRLLDRINEVGMEGLSSQEKDRLRQLSNS
jgi:hypothetical protein